MRGKTVGATVVSALIIVGGAAGYTAGTIFLKPGQCAKVSKTRVCARVAPTVTVAPVPNAPVTFTGNGSISLAPFTMKNAGFVSWTWDGGSGFGSFFVNDDAQHSVVFDSKAKSGKSYLPAGTHQFSVIVDGNWTITAG